MIRQKWPQKQFKGARRDFSMFKVEICENKAQSYFGAFKGIVGAWVDFDSFDRNDVGVISTISDTH